MHKGKPFAIGKLPKSNLIFWKKIWSKRPRSGMEPQTAIANSNRSHADACDLRYLLDYVAKKPFPKSVRWHFHNLNIISKPCICKQNRTHINIQFGCGNHPHSGKLPHTANSMR